jgi:hypothetical protein
LRTKVPIRVLKDFQDASAHRVARVAVASG